MQNLTGMPNLKEYAGTTPCDGELALLLKNPAIDSAAFVCNTNPKAIPVLSCADAAGTF